MSTKLSATVDDDVAEQFKNKVNDENTTQAAVIRDLVSDYIEETVSNREILDAIRSIDTVSSSSSDSLSTSQATIDDDGDIVDYDPDDDIPDSLRPANGDNVLSKSAISGLVDREADIHPDHIRASLRPRGTGRPLLRAILRYRGGWFTKRNLLKIMTSDLGFNESYVINQTSIPEDVWADMDEHPDGNYRTLDRDILISTGRAMVDDHIADIHAADDVTSLDIARSRAADALNKFARDIPMEDTQGIAEKIVTAGDEVESDIQERNASVARDYLDDAEDRIDDIATADSFSDIGDLEDYLLGRGSRPTGARRLARKSHGRRSAMSPDDRDEIVARADEIQSEAEPLIDAARARLTREHRDRVEDDIDDIESRVEDLEVSYSVTSDIFDEIEDIEERIDVFDFRDESDLRDRLDAAESDALDICHEAGTIKRRLHDRYKWHERRKWDESGRIDRLTAELESILEEFQNDDFARQGLADTIRHDLSMVRGGGRWVPVAALLNAERSIGWVGKSKRKRPRWKRARRAVCARRGVGEFGDESDREEP